MIFHVSVSAHGTDRVKSGSQVNSQGISFHFGGKQGKDRKGLAGINGRLRGQGD